VTTTKTVKVKGPDIYVGLLLLTGKPEQLQFTVHSGILTSISSRQHSVISAANQLSQLKRYITL